MTKKNLSRDESIEAVKSRPSQQPQQKTITDLFSSARSTPSSRSLVNQSSSPLKKRQKLDTERPFASSSSAVHVPAATTPNMYQFPTSATPFGRAQSDGLGKARASSRPTSPFTPHTGAKKLVVKNLRARPRVDAGAYFEQTWAQLDEALTAIFDNRSPQLSFEELYRAVENICRLGKAAQLEEKLRQRTDNYVASQMGPETWGRASGQGDIELLRWVRDGWKLWMRCLTSIRSIFYYLDQSYLLHANDRPVIQEYGLVQFRSALFADAKVGEKILWAVCQLMDAERRGVVVGTISPDELLCDSISMFHQLGVYSSQFEPYFLRDCERIYTQGAQSFVGDLKQYVEMVQEFIQKEMDRAERYSILRSTRQALSALINDHFIIAKQRILLDGEGIGALLRSGEKDALKGLYMLLQRTGHEGQLKPSFNSYVADRGVRIVFDEEHQNEMIDLLLGLKAECDDLVWNAFGGNEDMQEGLREAFDTFMNKPLAQQGGALAENTKPGEMIAKYVDNILKGGWKLVAARQGKNTSQLQIHEAEEDAEINRQLDQVLELFRFVHGKAVFEAFYKNDLARRLLMGRSASDEAEKSMLSKLRLECGSGFTHNLETMFKDMDLARGELNAYHSLLQERNAKRKLDLNVHVLSSAAWPSYPDVDVNLPSEISNALEDFEAFYNGKHNGRKLTWKHSLAYCQLKASFPKGKKEIVVSSFQALVLLLFNDVKEGEQLSYSYIRDALNLPPHEVKRTLQSLACAQYRVLNKHPKGREVSDTDTFTFNTNFHTEKFRIKINQIQLKETKAENQATHERVAADRHLETQAAIVRIMKSRKQITHAELVSEVIKATRHRGQLDVGEIKKNIEKLIEKDYMARDTETNSYTYVA